MDVSGKVFAIQVVQAGGGDFIVQTLIVLGSVGWDYTEFGFRCNELARLAAERNATLDGALLALDTRASQVSEGKLGENSLSVILNSVVALVKRHHGEDAEEDENHH